MKFVALISGGKDSIYSIMECMKHGHTLICTAHLSPRLGLLETDSFMYQSAGSNIIDTLSHECLGVPCYKRQIEGDSVNTSLVYNGDDDNDEVEDLYLLLKDVLQKHPDIDGVCSGAILSTYQRVRVENVCHRLNVTPLSYLWRFPQSELLTCMVQDNLHAVLVKVAGVGLSPRKHLNKSLAQLQPYFEKLYDRFRFHVCGEGGEYETLVLDCGIYKRRLVFEEVEIVCLDGDEDDGVGLLKILKCHSEEKEQDDSWSKDLLSDRIRCLDNNCEDDGEVSSANLVQQEQVQAADNTTTRQSIQQRYSYLPHCKMMNGGLFHISEIISPKAAATQSSSSISKETAAAVTEAKSIFEILRNTLKFHQMTPQDVIFCHLYLSEISHFKLINAHYRELFGTFLPPSRSCVSVGKGVLPGGRRVLLDVCAQHSSGRYMRKNTSSSSSSSNTDVDSNSMQNKLRQVLHVQGLSYWAPVCVGPYSQANTIRGSMIMLAGQIGLDPPTMTFKTSSNNWKGQLEQAWKNAANVLDGLSVHSDTGKGSALMDCFGALVYVSSDLDDDDVDVWSNARSISVRSLCTNGGIVPGFVDGIAVSSNNDNDHDGYEDEETRREMEGDDHLHDDSSDNDNPIMKEASNIPILIIRVPEMPVGALSEVELVCATHKLSSSLPLVTATVESSTVCLPTQQQEQQHSNVTDQGSVMWDCGYQITSNEEKQQQQQQQEEESKFDIEASIRYAKGCCGMAWIIAKPSSIKTSFSSPPHTPTVYVTVTPILTAMVDKIGATLHLSGMEPTHILHVRLYYIGSEYEENAMELKTILNMELYRLMMMMSSSSTATSTAAAPCCSVIPVKELEDGALFAAQIMMNDLVHAETEMWVHHGRNND